MKKIVENYEQWFLYDTNTFSTVGHCLDEWGRCAMAYVYDKKKNPIAILKKRGKREKGMEEIKIINNSYFSTQENSSYFIG